ncbi:hypothetical protein RBSWK_00423 [Rhodopirellula baltica SWK14]|uniref:Uncharacterized protein n=1 Tax=Rhodopirellula baltica SWK14 TaxID=993516 RepID=L7CP08_RHOBT|nr:hypothetical protein RBSWK_00423 [Rhodopirellula baltica SWK14]
MIDLSEPPPAVEHFTGQAACGPKFQFLTGRFHPAETFANDSWGVRRCQKWRETPW